MAGNSTPARHVVSTVEADLDALERLPLALRRAVAEFHVNMGAEGVLRMFTRECDNHRTKVAAIKACLASIEASAWRELEIFDQKYRAQHQCAAPSVASGVPPQRYGDWNGVPLKNRPREFSRLRRLEVSS